MYQSRIVASNYERPFVQGPFHAYEQPMLLDLEAAASCNWGCATSGDAAPTKPKEFEPMPDEPIEF